MKTIKNIERNISIKRLKSQKMHSMQILCISILTCILMQTSFQMTAGIERAFLERKQEIYGEWGRILGKMQGADIELIDKNPFIDKKGRIEIYGVLEGEYAVNKQSNIGTMDQKAWELGRLEMREGRLPENADEIALEYSMASALGLENSVGNEITLQIIPSLEVVDRPAPVEVTCVLSGIIKDYQVNWDVSISNRFPTGILTEKGAQKIGGLLETQMLIKAKEGYETVYEDLEKSEELQCAIGENRVSEEKDGNTVPFHTFFSNIRIFVVATSISVLIITISHSINSRRRLWEILYALGTETTQMYKMLFWEAAVYCMLSAIIGTILGIILYWLAIPAMIHVTGFSMTASVSAVLLGKGALYGVSVILVSYFLAGMKLNKILNGGKEKKVHKKRRKGDRIRKLTPLSLVIHQWREIRFRKMMQILFLAGAIVIISLGIFEFQEKERELAAFKETTGNGYYLTAADSLGISKKLTQALSQIAGVESVEAYNSSGAQGVFTVDFSAYKDSSYFQKIMNTMKKYNPNTSLQQMDLMVLGINRPEDLERFARNLDEGNHIDYSDFEQGNSCILLLPPLERIEDPEFGEIYLGNPVEELQRKSFIKEEKMEAGNSLSLCCVKENGETIVNDVRVDGIFRTAGKEDCKTPLPVGGCPGLIVGSGFWKQFDVGGIAKYYQTVRVNLTEDADILETEMHVLRNIRMAETVEFTNWHQEYTAKKQDMYSFMAAYSIFAIFYTVLTIVVMYQMLEAEVTMRKRKENILKNLGMEKQVLIRMRWMEIFLMAFVALLIGFIVSVGYYMLQL